VKVSFTLAPRGGEPTKVEVVSGHQLLKQAALENVKMWRFENSSSAERTYETTFEYRISIGQKSAVCFESFQTVEIRAGEVPVIED
jgi:outer membrane biosynthesis protein TonB